MLNCAWRDSRLGFKLPPFIPCTHPIDSQSPRWGKCFTFAPKGQELHLHEVQVIQDRFIYLLSLSWSSSLTQHLLNHFRRTDRSLASDEERPRRKRQQISSLSSALWQHGTRWLSERGRRACRPHTGRGRSGKASCRPAPGQPARSPALGTMQSDQAFRFSVGSTHSPHTRRSASRQVCTERSLRVGPVTARLLSLQTPALTGRHQFQGQAEKMRRGLV